MSEGDDDEEDKQCLGAAQQDFWVTKDKTGHVGDGYGARYGGDGCGDGYEIDNCGKKEKQGDTRRTERRCRCRQKRGA